MQLITLANSDKNFFNSLVARHESGGFLQSWEWGQWQEQLGHKAIRVIIKDNDNVLLSAQVIEIKIPKLGQRYLYIPYGPLLHSKNNDILTFFLRELKQEFPKALFIRVESKDRLELNGHTTKHIQPGRTLILDLQKSMDELLADMHQKNRYNIKVADRHGVEIISEPIITPGQGLHLKEVVDLLVGTAGRQHYHGHNANYYKKFINFFTLTENTSPQLVVYKAMHEGELLGTALMMDFGNTRTYLFGGTSDKNKNVMAPYALHWQAIQDAKNNGKTKYDFWGIETASGQTPGFVEFKLKWGGRQVQYPPARDIIQRRLWYNIYTLLRSINRKI